MTSKSSARSATWVVIIVLVILSACVQPPLEAQETVEIVVHCGLGYDTIGYGGQEWHFDDDGNSSPDTWGNVFVATITVGTMDGRVVALGPDGRVHELVSGAGHGGGCM
jgi:hypothetical protein